MLGPWRAVILFALSVSAGGVSGVSAQTAEPRQSAKAVDSQRIEGDAVLALADAAMAGQKPAVSPDLTLGWQNAFLKAQQGTFVPFTVVVNTASTLPDAVLVYVRAVKRGTAAPRPAPPNDRARRPDRRPGGRDEATPDVTYPVDAIFPVELSPGDTRVARVRRGFSLPPGDYDVYVVVRERPRSIVSAATPRAAVLTQRLTVPDFWNGELTTSSVMLADRLTVLPAPLSADELVERPYVIGQNEIVPAEDNRFRRGEELVVVFLVYNPAVTPEKGFDLQVEYHFFKRGAGGEAGSDGAERHPPARDGERYFNHTDPQRFNPAVMGGRFDPSAGQPVLAGQGVPLAGFEAGEYRLAIVVKDGVAGTSVTREVTFTVGS